MTESSQENSAAYQTARTYLKAALEQMIETGRDLRQFGEFAAVKLGDTAVPAVRRFMTDVAEGRVTIDGLTESAKHTLLGPRVTPQEREDMIRRAAYFRAEQRGFAEGFADVDWYLAEREIDARLAQEKGLLQKGCETLSSAASIAEQELGRVKSAVAEWLEGRGSAGRPG